MREKLTNKLQQNKAFTLMEMLIVVGITVVLMGMSMLGIYQFTVSTRMTELDNYAKSIYLEAQNELIAQKVEGNMPRLEKMFETQYAGQRLTTAPADYTDNDNRWNELYYISKNDDYTQNLIPPLSYMYTDGGDYLIELNPKTGVIYGVFYWKEDAQIDYLQDILSLSDRSTDARKDSAIGYYGGVQSELLGDSKMLDQKVELINSEELYLKISYPITETLLTYFHTGMEIRYEIRDEQGNVCRKILAPGSFNTDNTDNVDVVYAGRMIEVYILLDSMETGYDIAALTAVTVDDNGNEQACSLNLDGTLAFTVYTYLDEEAETPPEDTTIAGHGLFANNTGKYIYSTDAKEDELGALVQANTLAQIQKDVISNTSFHMVEIHALRHLRNLDLLNQYNAGEDIGSHVLIALTSKIDFKNENFSWTFTKDASGKVTAVDYQTDTAKNPLEGFAPITNTVFTDTQHRVYVEGNNSSTTKNSLLQNFIVDATSDHIGIFASTRKVSFCNLLLEDTQILGHAYDNVGTLAGTFADGQILNTGAVLTTSYRKDGITIYYAKEDAAGYTNKMEKRCEQYKVTGGSNVGGLVGTAQDAEISECFAAVKVDASGNNVGGLIGNAAGSSGAKTILLSSYASADVYGNTNVGGIVGRAENLAIGNSVISSQGEKHLYGVYATGNIHASSRFGGIVGYAANSDFKQCTFYGVVHAKAQNTLPSEVNGGGFIGVNAGGNSFDAANASCTYLIQTGQNDNVVLTSGIKEKKYSDYLDEVTDSLNAGVSYPYAKTLINTAFPFGKHWEGQQHHYGDWKQQYVINTSLVYYERYEDGSYGYYCMTYMAENANQWLLDTLKDKVVVEDGYAVLSKYNLKYVDYELQVGSILQEDVDSGKASAEYMQADTLYVTKEESSFKQIKREGTLTFQACKENGVLTGSEANEFSVTGLYLYRLPYELQCTDRYNVDNFYDRLTLKNGVIMDNTDDTSDDVVVVDNLTFFYCPHFAKTAFNPNVNDEKSLQELTTMKKENPLEVAVRSARQLNALGRNPYYWNYKGGATKLSFVQEVDIDFGKYVKSYCGNDFNLLAFDQPYSNQPIGQYNGDIYSSFANQYDGCYHKIIDYCVKSANQYVGLFGEIYVENVKNDVSYHQIQNVVMLVSGENDGTDTYQNQPDPMLQNNAGYVIGTFVEDASITGDDRSRTGVGALIGSDYSIGVAGDESASNPKTFTVYNCASAGYKVEYHVGEYAQAGAGGEVSYHYGEIPQNTQTPIGIAVGGLVGYSRGNISNCSAVNDVKLVAYMDYASVTDTGYDENVGSFFRPVYKDVLEYGNNEAVFLGGFVGSYFYGTAKYCYSGGTIDVDSQGGHYVFRMRIGGFCPGWLYAPGLSQTTSSEKVRYENIYTYTDVTERTWSVVESEKANAMSFKYLIPAVGRMAIEYKSVRASIGDPAVLVLNGYSRLKWNTIGIDGDTQGVRAPGMSLYLTDTLGDDVAKIDSDSDVTDYFKQTNGGWFGSYNGKLCEGVSYEQLSDFDGIIKMLRQEGAVVPIELHKAIFTYTQTGASASDYPFPAFTFKNLKDSEGNEVKMYTHYGEWPEK